MSYGDHNKVDYKLCSAPGGETSNTSNLTNILKSFNQFKQRAWEDNLMSAV